MWAKRFDFMGLEERVDRASARALIGIGTRIAIETKLVTHVVTGTLERSVHVAPRFYDDEDGDLKMAQNGADLVDMSGALHPTKTSGGWEIEVGSWLPYACVEWVGRAHPGITQGLEASRPLFGPIVMQAFREEGL